MKHQNRLENDFPKRLVIKNEGIYVKTCFSKDANINKDINSKLLSNNQRTKQYNLTESSNKFEDLLNPSS